MNKTAVLVITISILATGCTWQDAAKVTANVAVYTAMICTGTAGDFNMVADLAGQTAEDMVDLSIDAANDTCSDSDQPAARHLFKCH